MRRILLLLLLQVIPYLLHSQVVIRNEGLTVNNTETGIWQGVNIPRAVKSSLTFINNSITSVNSSGYLLQAGEEGPSSTNNNLDGAVITGNKFVWNGTDMTSITHGLFTGHNLNVVVKYNYLEKVPMSIIRKTTINMTNTSGGVAYNIINNPVAVGAVVKGMSGVCIYNNTFYSERNMYAGPGNGTWRGLVDIYVNDDNDYYAVPTGTIVKNNIFYTKNRIFNIYIHQADAAPPKANIDYNVYYCEDRNGPLFNYCGTSYNWDQWRALGYDVHSVLLTSDPFKDHVNFVPKTRLDHGTDLGSTWQTGLSTSASWKAGSAPATTNQNGKWQAGAVLYPPEAVVTPPVVVPPPAATPPATGNTPPVIVINYSSDNLSGFVGELDATSSYDVNNDNLTYTWEIPSNVSVSSSNSSKIRFLSPVVNKIQIVEFTLKISDGKTTQSKTVPVKIIPYKTELEFAEVINIEASSFQSPNYPYNILDGNIGTMWSANGDEEWIIAELKELFSIQHIKIAFQPGQKTASYFDVFGSKDKEIWEPILNKSASCGFSGDPQVFNFPATKAMVEYKFIKLIGHSNSANSWNYISELKVYGSGPRNNVSYEEQPVKLYPNPANESVNIRIDDSKLNPDLIRIVSLAGKVVFEQKMDPDNTNLRIPINFRSGVYIVQMGSGDLTLFTRKLIVKS